MAAKLECEICGGKLIGKPGGIFECENCGTEYSTEWAKAKIQEITGTVKVEGTVEVTGKVQVDGPVKVEGAANAQSLVKRGFLALEDSKWEEATRCFDDALNADPECAEAYLGLSMAEQRLKDKTAFAEYYINRNSDVKNDKNTERAIQFAKSDLRGWFESLEGQRQSRLELLERQRQEKSLKDKERLAPIFRRLAAYRGLIAAGEYHTVGLKVDGTVVAAGRNNFGQCDVSKWENIIAVAAGAGHTIGLKSDGTVVATRYKNEVSEWKDIISVAAGDHPIGLKADGTVVGWLSESHLFGKYGLFANMNDVSILSIAAGKYEFNDRECIAAIKEDGEARSQCAEWKEWKDKDIVAVDVGRFHTVGLKSNGSVVAANQINENEYNKKRFDFGQYNVSEWKLFKSDAEKEADYSAACVWQTADTKESLRKAADAFKVLKDFKDSRQRVQACNQAYERKLQEEKNTISIELANLKGLFSGRRRKEIEARLEEIEKELQKL